MGDGIPQPAVMKAFNIKVYNVDAECRPGEYGPLLLVCQNHFCLKKGHSLVIRKVNLNTIVQFHRLF